MKKGKEGERMKDGEMEEYLFVGGYKKGEI